MKIETDRILISWADGRTQRLALDRARGVGVIGRASDADLQIEEPGLSRHHLRFELGGEGWELVGANTTTNATFLNGDQVLEKRRALRDGDILQVEAMPHLLFRLHDAHSTPRLTPPPRHDTKLLITPEQAAQHGLPCGLEAPRLAGFMIHSMSAPAEWLRLSSPPGGVCGATVRLGPTPLGREDVWDVLWAQHVSDVAPREHAQLGHIPVFSHHVEARGCIIGQSLARRAVLLAPVPLPGHAALAAVLCLELSARQGADLWPLLTHPDLARLTREVRFITSA